MATKDKGFDAKYVKGIVDDLSQTTREQGKILVELKGIAIETKTILEGQAEKARSHDRKLEEHDRRIRSVERRQDGCKADVEISAIKKQLNRFIAFKDMIMSRADQDSKVIDIHAARMKAAVEAQMVQQVPYKILLIKMLPWFIVIFITGIALTSIILFKSFSGNTSDLLPSVPKIDLNANLSSQGGKK